MKEECERMENAKRIAMGKEKAKKGKKHKPKLSASGVKKVIKKTGKARPKVRKAKAVKEVQLTATETEAVAAQAAKAAKAGKAERIAAGKTKGQVAWKMAKACGAVANVREHNIMRMCTCCARVWLRRMVHELQ